MSLKNRMSRLGLGAPLSQSERAAREVSPVVAGLASLEPAAASSSPLEALRERLARSLVRNGADAARPAEMNSTPAWPFLREETAHGFITRRILRFPSAHAVGRVSVSAALESSPALLALLALDPTLAECTPSGALFFDTETTGLGGAGTLAFLVGLAWFEGSGELVLEQLFLQSPGEEVALLEFVRARVERASFLVSFNGKSFDLPLLETRAVMTARPVLVKKPHLDLLHVSRRLHKARLGRCRLVDLETEVLGWQRGEDDVSGAEIAPRYGHFLRTGELTELVPVVEHNAWDIVTLAALVALYGEPMEQLHPRDLVSAAETARRARDHAQARSFVDAAIERGAGLDALRCRAQLEKARGDRALSLADFRTLSEQIDDGRVRLELAKLYEHFVKDFEAALRVLSRGTSESAREEEKRRERLLRKSAKRRSGTS